MIPGTRLYALKDDWSDLADGCYYKLPDGDWAIRPPGSFYGTLSPAVHAIEEHEDGTITVTPSILQHGYGDKVGTRAGWHGYLERGQWRVE